MKKVKAVVIINEAHKLFPEQREILDRLFEWERLDAPKNGWTLAEMEEMADELYDRYCEERFVVVFASPIPALMKLILGNHDHDDVLIFHNDHREKVELPDGRIINRVAKTGWRLA